MGLASEFGDIGVFVVICFRDLLLSSEVQAALLTHWRLANGALFSLLSKVLTDSDE